MPAVKSSQGGLFSRQNCQASNNSSLMYRSPTPELGSRLVRREPPPACPNRPLLRTHHTEREVWRWGIIEEHPDQNAIWASIDQAQQRSSHAPRLQHNDAGRPPGRPAHPNTAILKSSPQMHKLLALNRGEIAIRILRAANELGLRTVAVCLRCRRVPELHG